MWNAGVAQLVEYKLPKLGVASSSLVTRFIIMKKLLLSLAALIILASCEHRNTTNEPVKNNVIAEFSFMTRGDFALYIYSNLHDSKHWENRKFNLTPKSAIDYAIYKKYMYDYPNGDFGGDRLLTWIDFVMFLGAFYNKINHTKKAILPPLKNYSYLKDLFSVLIGNKLLNYEEIAEFKGNFPIPEAIVKNRVQILNWLMNEN